MVKEAQAEKKILSEKISQNKCDCDQINLQRKNFRENEKKAAEE